MRGGIAVSLGEMWGRNCITKAQYTDLYRANLKQILLPMLNDLSFRRLKQIKFYEQTIPSYNTQGASYTPDGLEHVERIGADCRRLVVGADWNDFSIARAMARLAPMLALTKQS
jgi:hypothetical protein